MDLIYMDYNATTPVSPDVFEAMRPWFTDQFWNPASSHAAGRRAVQAVDRAREEVARLIGASSPKEIVWTSGATEANNLALKGLAGSTDRRVVVVSTTEHKAVLDVADDLGRQGYEIRRVPVSADGTIDEAALIASLDDSVGLVSVMLANNETGVIQDLKGISELVHRWGCLLHSDATQAVGKTVVDVDELGVDLLSLSAHKFYGPKGVGALYIRRGTRLHPQIHGGGHESGTRSGTINVPGVVGIGAAATQSASWIASEDGTLRRLTERLYERLRDQLVGVHWIGSAANKLPNTANLRFRGVDAEAVMANAPTVAVSSGSACSASTPEPSHVLQAMGMSQEEAYECLRFSLGRPTAETDVDAAADAIVQAVQRVRALNDVQRDISTYEGAAS